MAALVSGAKQRPDPFAPSRGGSMRYDPCDLDTMKLLAPLLLLISLAVGAGLTGQSATYRVVGTSCTQTPFTSIPFSVSGTPKLGSSFTVITGGSANLPWGNLRRAHMYIGVSNTQLGGLKLPFDISALGSGFCGILRTSAEIVIPIPRVVDYRVPIRITYQVPNLTSLVGVRFYQQVASRDFSTFGADYTTLSASGVGTIGY